MEPLAGNAVDHSTTPRPNEPLPAPTTVSEAAWVWESPAGSFVTAVHPSSNGAIMELNNGAVALDTSTGEEAWRFLLPEYHTAKKETDLSVSPDGSVIAFTPGQSMVVLDAESGEEIIRLEHNASGPSQFTPTAAGLIGDYGLFTVDSGNEAHVTMQPWDEGDSGWETVVPACTQGELADVSQGVLTDAQIVIEYSCPFQEATLVGIDQAEGEELWRLEQGRDYSPDQDIFPAPSPSADFDFGVVGDLVVLQNISEERGTVVIDTISGQVLTDRLPSTVETPLLRVLPDGYLTVQEEVNEDSTNNTLTYELRDFDGNVRSEVITSPEVARGRLNNFLVLDDSLLKVRMTGATESQDMAVLDWDSKEDHRIPLPVSVDTTGIPSIGRADSEVGPSTFRSVPGAIILREFPGVKNPQRVVGFH